LGQVWVSWPCTGFCCFSRLNLARGASARRTVLASRRQGKVFLRHACAILALQADGGRKASCENPLNSTAWKERETLLLRKAPFSWVRLDQCMVGLRCQGGLHMKPTAICSNDPEMLRALGLACDRSHTHVTVQGKFTKISEEYPPKMAQIMADVVMAAQQGRASRAPKRRLTSKTRENPDAEGIRQLVVAARRCCAPAHVLETEERAIVQVEARVGSWTVSFRIGKKQVAPLNRAYFEGLGFREPAQVVPAYNKVLGSIKAADTAEGLKRRVEKELRKISAAGL
jgi:hypothetical protein